MTKAKTQFSEKIRYLRDPKNPNRVLTLVTRVVGPTVTFAVAMNSPHETRAGYAAARPGDRFTRKTGTMIALGRLDSGRESHVTTMRFDPNTQHPLVVALTSLSEHTTTDGKTKSSVARIARSALRSVLVRRAARAAAKTGAAVTT